MMLCHANSCQALPDFPLQTYKMAEIVTNAKLLIVPTKNLTHSVRKEKTSFSRYNFFKIIIGHWHDHCLELNDVLGVLRSRVIKK